MGIPESQFETWAKQGATSSATVIYDRIKQSLKGDERLAGVDFEVFLQGSYRNSTNIRGDSDVDVVVKLNETYIPDYSRLNELEKIRVTRAEKRATYGFFDFREDVAEAIRGAFPSHNVTEGGKSIKIPRTSNNIPADVVPCLTYRQHLAAPGFSGAESRIDGIWLKDIHRGSTVVSFPKQHYTNGVEKHADTLKRYKPTVRVFKNIRGRMESKSLIRAGSTSSHSIECLLYNVPIEHFGSSHEETYIDVVNWLDRANLDSFMCQNGVQPLFAPGKWTVTDARDFIDGLINLWNNWN